MPPNCLRKVRPVDKGLKHVTTNINIFGGTSFSRGGGTDRERRSGGDVRERKKRSPSFASLERSRSQEESLVRGQNRS